MAETRAEDESEWDERLTPTQYAIALGAFFALIPIVMLRPLLGQAAAITTGVSLGTGVALLLQLFMWTEVKGTLTEMEPDDVGNALRFRSFHQLAAGFALMIGGTSTPPLWAMFTTGFSVVGLLATLLVAAVLYLPLAWALPNAKV